ncbi:MAG: homoserine O-acetyltransferase [Chitinophagaceae bacterium]|nr:homoserine O-acetyltransferase [Chitinophagaceae bacterium]
MKQFRSELPFTLESGAIIEGLNIAYHTYGELNSDKSNVVWICHHLTANSDAALWWKGVVGEGYIIDPSRYFIVCANILGSCYGTTGPLSINPATGSPYYSNFPFITIRDMVKAHMLLREHLGIDRIHLMIGGSMGGYQALEWSIIEKDLISNLLLLSTSAAESAWGIAVHTAQRLAIEADGTWQDKSPDAGKKGLKAARAIGLISYRNHGILVKKQTDEDSSRTDNFRASSYIEYQGEKLVNRFNAQSYYILTKAMDSHNLSRNRKGDMKDILKEISQKTLIFGIHSDILCPLVEQEFLARNIPSAKLITIDSAYGHDGFMVEAETISKHIAAWLG